MTDEVHDYSDIEGSLYDEIHPVSGDDDDNRAYAAGVSPGPYITAAEATNNSSPGGDDIGGTTGVTKADVLPREEEEMHSLGDRSDYPRVTEGELIYERAEATNNSLPRGDDIGGTTGLTEADVLPREEEEMHSFSDRSDNPRVTKGELIYGRAEATNNSLPRGDDIGGTTGATEADVLPREEEEMHSFGDRSDYPRVTEGELVYKRAESDTSSQTACTQL